MMEYVNKNQYLTHHAKVRAYERYGIRLNRESYRELCGQIKRGASEFVSKTSNDRSVHRVELDGVKLNVVWSKKRRRIITVLPENCVELKEANK